MAYYFDEPSRTFNEICFSSTLYVRLISGYPVFVHVHGTERTLT